MSTPDWAELKAMEVVRTITYNPTWPESAHIKVLVGALREARANAIEECAMVAQHLEDTTHSNPTTRASIEIRALGGEDSK